MEKDSAFAQLAQAEADTVVQMLAAPGRKLFVLILAVEGDQLGICRVGSNDATPDEAEAILHGLDVVRERLARKINEAGN